MQNVIIILNEDGTFESVLTDSEMNVKVLRKGKDDVKIEEAESIFEQVEL